MEIVVTFEACVALLKKFVENGHFGSPLKFSSTLTGMGMNDRLCLKKILSTLCGW